VQSRLLGAIIRAILVVALVALPSVLMVEVSSDTKQMVTLAALLAGGLIFAEYNAVYPSLIEFRDAAPFNRLRFLMLFTSVAVLTLIQDAVALPTAAAETVRTFGAIVGNAMDFPLSPVHLLTQMVQSAASEGQIAALRSAAGLAYLISVSWLALFAIIVRIGGWPNSKRPLNVWVNLPMFDPTAGADVVTRLARHGRVNILLGFLLPFLVPVAAKLMLGHASLLVGLSPHSMIWIISLWAFFPASLILRGLALLRIAELIVHSRNAHATLSPSERYAPA
jgi:hypothetical protein